MPQKLNKAGKMQDYIPAGNGDPSGEYGTSNGTNKNFTASDKKSSKANVITENKSVVVGNKKNKTIKVRNEDVDIVDEMPNGFAVDEVLNKTSPYTPDGYLWISDAETSTLKDRQYKLIEKDKWYNREKDTKANIINDDLTGKKKYDDSDIRNMKESDFPVGASKKGWEEATANYEKNKPLLDKLGIKIEDVKTTKSEHGGMEDNIREIMDKYVFNPFKEKYGNGNNEAWNKEYKPIYDAIDSLEDKVYYDWYVRNPNPNVKAKK